MNEAQRKTGVMPDLDGTWAAVCPICCQEVVRLEQWAERAEELLASHQMRCAEANPR